VNVLETLIPAHALRISLPCSASVHLSKLHFMQHSNANAVISMRIGKHEECTILVSKSNSKYRLQGSSLRALWLPMVELVCRLRAHFAASTGEELSLQLEEELPLQHLISCINNHFSSRLQRKRVLMDTEKAAAQVCISAVHLQYITSVTAANNDVLRCCSFAWHRSAS
jgi:hypothetical protein